MNGWLTCSSIRLSRIIFRTLSDLTTINMSAAITFPLFATLQCLSLPSSFRIYLRANVRLVSLRSTIRTLPKAPRPTTRNSRKWFRFTVAIFNSQLYILSFSSNNFYYRFFLLFPSPNRDAHGMAGYLGRRGLRIWRNEAVGCHALDTWEDKTRGQAR